MRACRTPRGGLERLPLHCPELRGWVLPDWVNSAFWAIIIAGAFPVFFLTVARGSRCECL